MLAIQILVLSATVNAQFYYPYYLGYGGSGYSNTYGGIGSSLSNRPSNYYNSYNWPYQNSYPGTYTNSYAGSGGWNGITFPTNNNNYGNYGGNVGSYYGYANYNPWQYYWGYGDRKKRTISSLFKN